MTISRFLQVFILFCLCALTFGACGSGGGGSSTINPHVFPTGSIAVVNEDGHKAFSNLIRTGQIYDSEADFFPEKNTYLRFETDQGISFQVARDQYFDFSAHLVGRLGITGDAMTLVTGGDLWIFAEALPNYWLWVGQYKSAWWSRESNLFLDFSILQDLQVDTGAEIWVLQGPVLGQISASGRAAVFEDAGGVAFFSNTTWPFYADAANAVYEIRPDPHTFFTITSSGDIDLLGYLTIPGPSYGEVSATGDHMAFQSSGDLHLFSRSLNYPGILAEEAEAVFDHKGDTFLWFSSESGFEYDTGGTLVPFFPPLEGWVSSEGACMAVIDAVGLGIFTPFLPTSVFLADGVDNVDTEYDSTTYVRFHSPNGLKIVGDFNFNVEAEVWGRAAETGGMVSALTPNRAYLFSGAFPGYFARIEEPGIFDYSPDFSTFLYFTTPEDIHIEGYGEIEGPCDGWVARTGDFVLIMNGDEDLLFFGRQIEGATLYWGDWEVNYSPDSNHMLWARGRMDAEPFGDYPFTVWVLR